MGESRIQESGFTKGGGRELGLGYRMMGWLAQSAALRFSMPY
jgi:hypothetical protein